MNDDRDLLFTDICARLKYNVKLRYKCFHIHSVQGLTNNGLIVLRDETDKLITTDIKNIQPYLFSLSSMSDEQKQYLKDRFCYDWDGEPYELWKYQIEIGDADELIDWFHKNHLDYRGLIPMGLAIDATGLNIY